MQIASAHAVPAMTHKNIEDVRSIEKLSLDQPQIKIPVQHALHAGMYARTVTIPAGVMITGVLVKIPTLLILSGDCGIYLGSRFQRIKGHRVLLASAHRKQIFIARRSTDLTMCFPTDAKTVKQAEEQFTDEAHLLQNREDC